MALATRSKTGTTTHETTVAHRIHALLHTVRVIGHAEDELCTLLHEAEHGGGSSPKFQRELIAVIETLQSQSYADDLRAVEQVALKTTRPVKAQSKRIATPAPRKTASRKVGGAKAVPARRARS